MESRKPLHRIGISLFLAGILALIPALASAQITYETGLGADSVDDLGNDFTIPEDKGSLVSGDNTNLFHSFNEFSSNFFSFFFYIITTDYYDCNK